jgi:hypothetical protein
MHVYVRKTKTNGGGTTRNSMSASAMNASGSMEEFTLPERQSFVTIGTNQSTIEAGGEEEEEEEEEDVDKKEDPALLLRKLKE